MRDRKNSHLRDEEAGTVTIFVVMGLLTLLAFTALAIDSGNIYVAKAQLQNVADAASLAGGGELGDIYTSLPSNIYTSYVMNASDQSQIFAMADGVAQQHQAGGGGVNIAVAAGDLQVGIWDHPTSTLNVTPNAPTTIQVTARRTNAVNSPVQMFLSHIVGVNQVGVSATAAAALTPLGGVGAGELTIPVGISEAWFANAPQTCNQPITLYPTGSLSGCAGWHTYFDSPASANQLRQTLNGLEDGSFTAPPTQVGDVLNFTGGTVSSVFSDMKALFDTRKLDSPPLTEWSTTVAVYDWPDCSNPTGPLTVSGFATLTITDVIDAPNQTIDAVVDCDIIVDGSGGGGTFGTLSSRPVLVD